jgi:glycosyl hydrolase family 59/glycosyl hydrolase family 59 (putative galactocerebrosidase)
MGGAFQRRGHRPPVLVLVGLVVVLATLFAGAPASAATPGTSITIDGTRGGRTFDGVGAISGGGGNSRYLIDYPEPQRSQVLDYLFKPDYGAAIQVLKVEMGGDTNSTDGAEPSHMHTRGQAPNCGAGYEPWLMQQARARNHNVRLYALAWGAPGWIGGGNFWSQDMIDYIVAFLSCARSNGTPIDYVGGWNERHHNKGWYESLRSTLDGAGFSSVRVVGDDSVGWGVANDMVADPAFDAAVDLVGVHYPCGYLKNADNCPSSANAISTGKPLWASENGSQDLNSGAGPGAKGINRGYIDGKMTGYLNWPLISSMPSDLKFGTDGLMLAPQPWSGFYQPGKLLWTVAQTTQFAQPGWRYIDSASGYLGGSKSNGSYVTLRSPGGSDYSTVVETMNAGAPQTLKVKVTGGLSTGTVSVWSTNLSSSKPGDWLKLAVRIQPTNGAYMVTLQPGSVYTLTTTTGQGKGAATSAGQHSFPFPYSDTFDSETVGTMPRFLAPQTGAFEVVGCGGGRSGRCVRQMAPVHTIDWVKATPPSTPYATIGDDSLTDYTVRSDVMLETAGSVELIGRATRLGGYGGVPNAYYLRVTDTGAWQILKGAASKTSASFITLAQGTVTSFGTNRFHALSLAMRGSTIAVSVDGRQVGSVQDSSYRNGMAGYATGVTDGKWETAQFDNLSLS